MMLDKKLFYVSDVASSIGCSSHKIYAMLKTGELKGFQDVRGGTWRIPAYEVEQYIADKMKSGNQIVRSKK